MRAQNNMIKAIEQGIITDATKGRLTELEAEINHLDFEIAKEKAHNYAFLTVEQIESYLSHFVFDNTDNVKVRKLIINTFVREVILYEDEIVITYNFTDSPERLKVNKEQILQEEKQIKRAKHSFSFNSGSTILADSPPHDNHPHLSHLQERMVYFYHAFCSLLANTSLCSFLSHI